MVNTGSLSEYLAEGIRQKVTHAELKQHALSVGWLEEEFNAAYAVALVSSGVPVPDRGPTALIRKSSTVEIIISFFSFIILCALATAQGVLLFQVVNRFFPDPLAGGYRHDLGFSRDAVHYSIATLIVGFPLYYFAMRLWLQGAFREGVAKVESKLTKWVTYLLLLAASVTIVGDLIAVLFYLLRGEITTRFLLKTLVILAIGGAVLGFYFLERGKVQYRRDIPRRWFQTFGYATSSFVLISIVLGFLAGGSPVAARKRNLDAQRASNLSELASCIGTFAKEYDRLPADLPELRKSQMGNWCAGMTDPETGASYEYRVVNASKKTERPTLKGVVTVMEGEFELCATFAYPTDPTLARTVLESKWAYHGAGRECQTETVAFGE